MRRILIVDGDPTAALVTQHGLQMLLKDEATDVTTASLSDEGWPKRLPGAVDLLIIDPGAQSQTASKILKTLLAQQPQLGILILTAYDSPGLRKQMQTIGVHHYLAKPIDLRDLEQVVRQVLHIS